MAVGEDLSLEPIKNNQILNWMKKKNEDVEILELPQSKHVYALTLLEDMKQRELSNSGVGADLW